MELGTSINTSRIARVAYSPPRLWTPTEGPSGLLVVPQPRLLLAVVGRHVMAVGSNRLAPWKRRETAVTLDGLITISASRRSEPSRVIGHPDLASGSSVRQGDTLYVSIAEAVYRQTRGEEAEVHFASTAEDDAALAGFRARARRRWESDHLPDGWTRPLPPPKQKIPRAKDDELPHELRALAEEIRAKQTLRPEDAHETGG